MKQALTSAIAAAALAFVAAYSVANAAPIAPLPAATNNSGVVLAHYYHGHYYPYYWHHHYYGHRYYRHHRYHYW